MTIMLLQTRENSSLNANNSNHTYNMSRILTTNARSILNKVDELYCVLVYTLLFDVTVITRHGAPNLYLKAFSFPGYLRFRHDHTNKKGGRVLVMVKDTFLCIQRNDIAANNIESLWIVLS